jgi:hypothetical protein
MEQSRMERKTTLLGGLRDRPPGELFELPQSTPAGLTTDEASERLSLYQSNSPVERSRLALFQFFRFLAPSSLSLPAAYLSHSVSTPPG